MNLEHFRNAPYRVGARGPEAYDCWGQVRLARHVLCGKMLLPEYPSATCETPREITRAWRHGTQRLRASGPEDGAIAGVFRKGLCIHVALVLAVPEGLRVLETNQDTGARILRLDEFENDYLRVEYVND